MKREEESQPGVHPDPIPDEHQTRHKKPAPTQHPDPDPKKNKRKATFLIESGRWLFL